MVLLELQLVRLVYNHTLYTSQRVDAVSREQEDISSRECLDLEFNGYLQLSLSSALQLVNTDVGVRHGHSSGDGLRPPVGCDSPDLRAALVPVVRAEEILGLSVESGLVSLDAELVIDNVLLAGGYLVRRIIAAETVGQRVTHCTEVVVVTCTEAHLAVLVVVRHSIQVHVVEEVLDLLSFNYH